MHIIQSIMKRKVILLLLLFSGLFVLTTTNSCTRKVGCESEHNVGPKTKRDGTLKMKRGKSRLFKSKKRKRRRR